jgi:hypothetical protein
MLSLATFSGFVATAILVAWLLRRRGAPSWLVYAELIALPIASVFVTIRIHDHFDRAACRHSADYRECLRITEEAEMPEWEPPTE